jgi:high-affinity nickel-transport protein
MNTEVITLIGIGFSLGLRHALDWDHIAAITDFLGVDGIEKKGFRLSLYYVAGHASINLILVLLAVLLGQSLPKWVDTAMGRVVGGILIVFGFWILLVLIKNRNKKQIYASRGYLLVTGMQNLCCLIQSKLTGKPPAQNTMGTDVGPGSACSIGVIHGIGGETATQFLLFATAAGAGSTSIGVIV